MCYLGLPGAPEKVTVREQSPTLLVLDVAPPEDNGGIPIYGYRVQYEQSVQDFAIGMHLDQSEFIFTVTSHILIIP